MSKNENDFDAEYVSVSDLMKMYRVSRATVIRWIKNEDSKVRYFKDTNYIRVNLKDFKDMIDRRVASTMAEDQEKKNNAVEE